jgi:hypothetical protein
MALLIVIGLLFRTDKVFCIVGATGSLSLTLEPAAVLA